MKLRTNAMCILVQAKRKKKSLAIIEKMAYVVSFMSYQEKIKKKIRAAECLETALQQIKGMECIAKQIWRNRLMEKTRCSCELSLAFFPMLHICTR